jgi:hypothetical protein
VIEDTTGQIQELGARIDAASQEVASKGDELASATAVRKDQNDDFKSAEKELVDAVDTLSRAIVIIKRSVSFAQGKGMSRRIYRFSNNVQMGFA